MALYNNLRPPKGWQATSDAEGKFLLPDIPAGETYHLTATKRTYLPGRKPQYAQQTLLEVGASGLTGVTLPLMPQSVLAGTLVDASDQPVERVSLKAQGIPFSEQVKTLPSVGASDLTNDLGRFRLSGLPPGQYHLVRDNDEILGRYTVGPGQHLESLRVVLPQAVVFSVRARLTEPPSQSRQLAVRLQPGNHYGDVQPDGSYLFNRIPPGDFTAVAASPDYFATAPVSVRNADLANIELRPILRSTLRGRVRVEGPRRIPIEGIRFTVNTPLADHVAFDATTAAGGDFSVPGFPTGPAEIHAAAPAGAYIRSIQTKNGLTEIVLSTATAALEGTIEPPPDDQRFRAGVVYLVPAGKWLGALRNPERYQAFVTADLTFSMRDLAPGRYVAIASEALLLDGVSADRLRALKAFTKVINLAAGPPQKIVLPHTRVEHLVTGSIDLDQ